MFCFVSELLFHWVCYNIFNCPDLFVFSMYRECPIHIFYKFIFIAQCKLESPLLNLLFLWSLIGFCGFWIISVPVIFHHLLSQELQVEIKGLYSPSVLSLIETSLCIHCINEKDGFRSFSHTMGVKESPNIKDFPRFK